MNSHGSYQFEVELSASQARKRLKGYGFGVKKVQAIDRGRAVVVHTATGRHREELESLFADVVAFRSPGEAEGERPDTESA